MAIQRIKSGNDYVTQVDSWCLDTKNDLANEQLIKSPFGSTAFVILSGILYIKNSSGSWVALAQPVAPVGEEAIAPNNLE